MKVDSNSWHCRLWRFHYRMKEGCEPHLWNKTTNLCPYMRTVLFYWWLRYLFINGKIWLGEKFYIPVPIPVCIYLVFFFPGLLGVFSYDLKHSLIVLYIAVTILISVIAAMVAFVMALDKFKSWRRSRQKPGSTSFVGLTKAYTHAIHDKICPVIQIVDSETEE